MTKKPPRKPKRNCSFLVHAWMINDYGLHGTVLLVYALIHSFSMTSGAFTGSLSYLSFWTGLGKTTLLKILKGLVSLELVIKTEINYTSRNQNRHYCTYTTTRSLIKKE